MVNTIYNLDDLNVCAQYLMFLCDTKHYDTGAFAPHKVKTVVEGIKKLLQALDGL